ncbi:MAG: right-handed parallel beta-helix repeat-containing protein [Blastocatellia bacterium]
MRLMAPFVAGAALCFLFTAVSPAQTNDPRFYDLGNPTVKEIWVDANNGNDSNSGESRETAMRTLRAAWNHIPRGSTLAETGYHVKLAAGTYGSEAVPRYFELRYGTQQFPVIIQSADGAGAAVITAFMNIFDCRYLYLLDLKIAPEPAETSIHLEKCDHVLMRGLAMDGKGDASQVLKVNHCDSIYLEGCEVFGAAGSTVDFVAVRNGRIIANRVHDAGNWGILVKGGSAYFHVEANEIYNAARGGFSAGQTTGFEFLESPWLHYEAYDVKFVNNVVHDTGNGGMAVEGGYNILFAYNTLYHLGGDGSMFEVLYGIRVCSEDMAKCSQYQSDGGWGTAAGDADPIPNRNVFVYNNVLYNPPGFETRSSHFALFGPQTPSAGSNIPSPAELDRNLQIRGNVVWNGGADKRLGTEFDGVGCQPSNPTCNAAQLRADNAINTLEPQLIDPANGDFRPAPGGNLFQAKTYAIPNFDWSDAPQPPLAPAGNPENAVPRDRTGAPRDASSPPGAYTLPLVTTVSAANYKPAITAESVALAFGVNLAPKTVAANSSPLPMVLEGTSVNVRDRLQAMIRLRFARSDCAKERNCRN